jgi:hypothetical protein
MKEIKGINGGIIMVSEVDLGDNTISLTNFGGNNVWLDTDGLEQLIEELEDKLYEARSNEDGLVD